MLIIPFFTSEIVFKMFLKLILWRRRRKRNDFANWFASSTKKTEINHLVIVIVVYAVYAKWFFSIKTIFAFCKLNTIQRMLRNFIFLYYTLQQLDQLPIFNLNLNRFLFKFIIVIILYIYAKIHWIHRGFYCRSILSIDDNFIFSILKKWNLSPLSVATITIITATITRASFQFHEEQDNLSQIHKVLSRL